MEYIIVGDTRDYNGCLVYVCGADKSWAEQVLSKMFSAPTDSDKEVFPENCWWNDSFLAN